MVAITITTFQTALGLCADAIAAADWATATTQYAVASAILAGLEVQGGHEGTYFRQREDLRGVKVAIETARAIVEQQTENKRFIRTRTAFGR